VCKSLNLPSFGFFTGKLEKNSTILIRVLGNSNPCKLLSLKYVLLDVHFIFTKSTISAIIFIIVIMLLSGEQRSLLWLWLHMLKVFSTIGGWWSDSSGESDCQASMRP
jgi:hypothetical protein